MILTRKGKEIGTVELVETGIPGILPVVVMVITDDEIRSKIYYSRPEVVDIEGDEST